MNIDDLEPGRELDALAAEHIMGWKNVRLYTDNSGDYVGEPPSHPGEDNWLVGYYSTDIRDAMEVVDHLREQTFAYMLHDSFSDPETCYCFFTQQSRDKSGSFWIIDEVYEASSTHGPAHAICLAALKAVQTGDER